MTMMACQPGWTQRISFWKHLKVDGFKVTGHRLELLQDGTPVAYFNVAKDLKD